MCEDCAIHDVDCIDLMVARARPDQIRRLIRDILSAPDSDQRRGRHD